jgi:hypothetical protein
VHVEQSQKEDNSESVDAKEGASEETCEGIGDGSTEGTVGSMNGSYKHVSGLHNFPQSLDENTCATKAHADISSSHPAPSIS